MKIKLAILEKDQTYLHRLAEAFAAKYADRFEMYSFTDPKAAAEAIVESRLDVLLAGDDYAVEPSALPPECAFAWLVDAAEVDTYRGQRAIGRYQKAELICRQILGLYAEKAAGITGLHFGAADCRWIAFTSPAGGCGSSSMSAACAVHFARQGKRVLYLNLETCGTADILFSADGQFDFSDVIYALKNRKGNLALKLESCVRQDSSGVHFFSGTKIALDMRDFTSAERISLLEEINAAGLYDRVVVDADFALDDAAQMFFKRMHAVVWLSDGSLHANTKASRAWKCLEVTEQGAAFPLTDRVFLAYNRFSERTGQRADGIAAPVLGGAPRYEQGDARAIVQKLAELSFFDEIPLQLSQMGGD